MALLRRFFALTATAIESNAKGTRAEDALHEVQGEGGRGNCSRETPAAENQEESALTKHRPKAALSLPEFKLSNFT